MARVHPHGGEVLVAQATERDLEEITALHLECLSPSVNLASLLGAAFVRAAHRWFITSETTCVIKATVDGELAGFTTLSETPYTVPMLLACRRQALASLLLRPWLLLDSRVFWRLMSRLRRSSSEAVGGKNVAQVGFTAVSPRFRRRGVGARLKAASIDECRRRGSSGLLTGVAAGNRASIALNERFGFREVEAAASGQLRYYLLMFESEREVAGVNREDRSLPAAAPLGIQES